MWKLVWAGALLALAGCGLQSAKPGKVAPTLADKLSLGCYTVDLFDPYRLQFPESGVPKEYRPFIGVWKDAAWNGEWCHDLYITEIKPDGTVTLLDAHGPYLKLGHEATVFKRTARIENGVLSFISVGKAPVTYRLAENGRFLIGNRIDAFGKYEITMARTDGFAQVPLPPKKPRRS